MTRKPHPKSRSENFEDGLKIRTEQVVYQFPSRCPYCDEVVSFDRFKLKIGENEIECPSCRKMYLKVVPGPGENE